MMLHCLQCLPDSPAWRDALQLACQDDAILLMGNGVYAGLAGTEASARLLDCGAQLYLLEPDAHAAGVIDHLERQIQLVDYAGFVTLSERFPRQLAWY